MIGLLSWKFTREEALFESKELEERNMGKKKNSNEEQKRRIAAYQDLCADMESRGWMKIDGTISVEKATAMAFVTAGPFALLFLILYFWIWQWSSFTLVEGSLLLLLFLISIPVHEGIHGLTWGCFCKNRWHSIGFGVMWSSLTPYCHCKEPLGVRAYFWGGIMPFLILGVGVSFFALMWGNILCLWLGLLNLLAAGGDTTILYELLKCRKENGGDLLIVDHPNQCGFVAFRKNYEKIEVS